MSDPALQRMAVIGDTGQGTGRVSFTGALSADWPNTWFMWDAEQPDRLICRQTGFYFAGAMLVVAGIPVDSTLTHYKVELLKNGSERVTARSAQSYGYIEEDYPISLGTPAYFGAGDYLTLEWSYTADTADTRTCMGQLYLVGIP